MYPTGELWYTGDVADIAALIEQDDWPRGSEGPTNYRSLEYENQIYISIDGSLRDRGHKVDFDEVRQWFKRLIAAPQITKGYVEVHSGGFFCCAFYYSDDTYQEITAPVEPFLDIEDDE